MIKAQHSYVQNILGITQANIITETFIHPKLKLNFQTKCIMHAHKVSTLRSSYDVLYKQIEFDSPIFRQFMHNLIVYLNVMLQ